MTVPSDDLSNSSQTQETFGVRLRHLMDQRGISQTALAGKIGMDRTDLNRTVNDKRQPRTEEIGWIASALDLTAEELLDGLELPEEMKKGVERIEEVALRVLDAERSRDEALARVQALEAELAGAHQAHLAERAALEEKIKREQEAGQQAVHAARQEAAAVQRDLRTQLDKALQDASNLRVQLRGLSAENAGLKQQVQNLQAEIKRQKGKAVAAGVLSGLAGLGLGAAANSKGSRRR